MRAIAATLGVAALLATAGSAAKPARTSHHAHAAAGEPGDFGIKWSDPGRRPSPGRPRRKSGVLGC